MSSVDFDAIQQLALEWNITPYKGDVGQYNIRGFEDRYKKQTLNLKEKYKKQLDELSSKKNPVNQNSNFFV